MKDYEEAMNHLICGRINCLCDVYEDERLRAMCIDALEKQIPKKPTHLQLNPDGFMTWHCPNCGDYDRSEFAIRFCRDCGQAIDWSYDVDTEYEAYQDEMGGMAEVVASEVE